MIQIRLKSLHQEITPLVRPLINFNSKILYQYQFHNSIELVGIHQYYIHSMNFQAEFFYNPTVTSQSNRSTDQTFMLSIITKSDPPPTRPSLDLLTSVDIFSLTSTNNNPLRTTTILIATAHSSQTLYPPHTAPITGKFASLLPSTFVSTVNPINPPPVITQNFTLPFVAIIKSLKTVVDGLDHRKTPEEYSHQIDAHMNFNI